MAPQLQAPPDLATVRPSSHRDRTGLLLQVETCYLCPRESSICPGPCIPVSGTPKSYKIGITAAPEQAKSRHHRGGKVPSEEGVILSSSPPMPCSLPAQFQAGVRLATAPHFLVPMVPESVMDGCPQVPKHSQNQKEKT